MTGQAFELRCCIISQLPCAINVADGSIGCRESRVNSDKKTGAAGGSRRLSKNSAGVPEVGTSGGVTAASKIDFAEPANAQYSKARSINMIAVAKSL